MRMSVAKTSVPGTKMRALAQTRSRALSSVSPTAAVEPAERGSSDRRPDRPREPGVGAAGKEEDLHAGENDEDT